MNVLVTGGSRGLGLAIVAEQLTVGNRVIAVARQQSPALQELAERYPGKLEFVAIELGQVDQLKSNLWATDVLQSGPLHAVVNNAATAYDDLVSNLDVEPLEAMFRVNVFSAMMLTKLAIRHMLLHHTPGSIVFVSSVSAHTGYKGLAMYAATKGAIEAFSKNVAREWGAKGIRSNCVVPGFMETEMSANLTDDQKQRIYQRTSLKQASDLQSVAATVGFLISDASRSITGQAIHVDAGTI